MAASSSLARHDVLIIGGGAGGTAVASRLRRARCDLDVAVIDPAKYHYYQPAWTLVGAGEYRIERTRRELASLLPRGVQHVVASVAAVDAEAREVALDDGRRIAYHFLVVAAGVELDWGAIEGLEDTLGRNGVTSNYQPGLARYTWELVRGFTGGRAVFTQPGTPIKCPGAPQKAVYLSADYWRRTGVAADVSFHTAGQAIFGVPFYAGPLEKVLASHDAAIHYGHELVAVDGARRVATFAVNIAGTRTLEEVNCDLLHVVPPQRPPAFIRNNAALANAGGWLEVDQASLRHVRQPSIFGLGDCTSTPNSKTAAAVKVQAPVLADNLLAALADREPVQAYDGYAACPVTTELGKVMLAEFTYGGKVTPSFPLDPRVPRRAWWLLKKYVLPWLYWHVILRGRAWLQPHRPREFASVEPELRLRRRPVTDP